MLLTTCAVDYLRSLAQSADSPKIQQALHLQCDILSTANDLGIDLAFSSVSRHPKIAISAVSRENKERVFTEYLNLKEWSAIRELIERNAWLLIDELTAPDFARGFEIYHSDENIKEFVRSRQLLLDACRSQGCDVVFGDLETLWNLAESLISDGDNRDLAALVHNADVALSLFSKVGSLLGSALDQTILHNLLKKSKASLLLGSSHKSEDVETAICLLQEVYAAFGDLSTAHYSQREEQRNGVLLELVRAYPQRKLGDPVANINTAQAYADSALKWFTFERDPRNFAAVHLNNGGALLELRGYGTDLQRHQWMSLAVKHLDRAAEVFESEGMPAHAANARIQAGMAVESDPLRTSAQIEQTISRVQGAIDVLGVTGPRLLWASANNILANLLTDTMLSNIAHNIELAISALENSRTVFTCDRHVHEWTVISVELAKWYGVLAWTADSAELWKYQETLWKEVESNLETYATPELRLRLLSQQVRSKFGRDWAGVVMAFEKLLPEWLYEYNSATTNTTRRRLAADFAEIANRGAFARICSRDYIGAIRDIERGRAILLNDSLHFKARLRSLPEETAEKMDALAREIGRLRERVDAVMSAAMTQPGIDNISNVTGTLLDKCTELLALRKQAGVDFAFRELEADYILRLIPPHTTLIIPVVTSEGTAVLVLPSGTAVITDIHVIRLAVKTGDLGRLAFSRERDGSLSGLAVRTEDYRRGLIFRESLQQLLTDVSSQLWDLLLGPIHERLLELRRESGSRVIFVLQGAMNLLPVGSACRPTVDGVRYFIDDWNLSFAPGLQALKKSVAFQPTSNSSVLVIADPTLDLPGTRRESDAIGAMLGRSCTRLVGLAASSSNVSGSIPGHSHLHFACHGTYDWIEPDQSGLLLAQKVLLSVSRIRELKGLSHTRLVFLSACDTGLVDVQSAPEEFLGLPAAFIESGAAAVISTFWPVRDDAAMFLARRFYYEHFILGRPPADALRNAQLWLRNCTYDELAQLSRQADPRESASNVTSDLPASSLADRSASSPVGSADARPFQQTLEWAGFAIWGI